MSLSKFLKTELKTDSSSDSEDLEKLFERKPTKRRLRFRSCDSSTDEDSGARGVRHFLEGRTRFRNHSDFSEINDFISDFMISIVIS